METWSNGFMELCVIMGIWPGKHVSRFSLARPKRESLCLYLLWIPFPFINVMYLFQSCIFAWSDWAKGCTPRYQVKQHINWWWLQCQGLWFWPSQVAGCWEESCDNSCHGNLWVSIFVFFSYGNVLFLCSTLYKLCKRNSKSYIYSSCLAPKFSDMLPLNMQILAF